MNRGSICKCHLSSLRIAAISWVYIYTSMKCVIVGLYVTQMMSNQCFSQSWVLAWQRNCIQSHDESPLKRETRLMLKSVTSFPLERNWIMSHSYLFFAYNTNRWIHIHLNLISWELLCPFFSLNLLVHSDLMLMKPNMMQFGVVLMISSLMSK